MASNSRNKKSVCFTIIGMVFVMVSVLLITLFLLNGHNTIIEQNGNIIVNGESITCSGENMPYQFLSYDNAVKKTVKITISFNNDKFNAASLFYALYYNDSKIAESSKIVNSNGLNVFYSKDGLPSNSFSKSLYSDNEKAVISLYADISDFSNKTSKYFMADGLGKDSSPSSFEKIYETQGFKCEKNNTVKEINE